MNKLFFNQDHYMIQDMCRDFAQNEIAPVARGASSGIHHMGTIPQTGAPICGAVRAGSKVDGDGQAAPLQPLGPTPRLVDGVCSRPCQSDS